MHKSERESRMPEISRFYGIIVSMRFFDDGKHHKPHVHVKYGSCKASISLDGELLSGQLPDKQLRMVSGWLAIHEEELYTLWKDAIRGVPFGTIEPLK